MAHHPPFADLFPDGLLSSHAAIAPSEAHPGVDIDTLKAAFRLGRAADRVLTAMTRTIGDSGLTLGPWRALAVLAW